MFSRSEFTERRTENPQGALAPMLSRHSDNVMLFLGKLGWRWESPEGFDIETGVKLFLPFSPFTGDLFSYYERAGGDTLTGRHYGSERIARTLTAYLQGSF
jgi:hypothetical protein